jgi:hypothetical protein
MSTVLSFSVLEDLNVSRLLFLDTSDYSSIPVSPTLHVKFPDFKKIYTIPINFGQINIINTAGLKYSDCLMEFPDGVYELTYEVNNESCKIKNIYFRTTKAWKKLDEVLRSADFSNKELLDKFNRINLYLRGAESVVSEDQTQAQELYKEADNLLNCFNKNVRVFEKDCCR